MWFASSGPGNWHRSPMCLLVAAAVTLGVVSCGGLEDAVSSSSGTAASPPSSGAAASQDSASTTVDELISLADRVAGAAPGAVIVLESGDYLLDAPLEITAAITISGAGAGRTRLLGTSAGVIVAMEGSGPFALQGLTVAREGDERGSVVTVAGGEFRLTEVVVTGGTVDPDGTGGSGVVISGNSVGTIEDSEISGNAVVGLIVYDGSSIDVRGSMVAGNGSAGIVLHGDATADVRDTEVSGNGRSGIQAWDTADLIIQDTDVTGNAGNGLQITDDATVGARRCHIGGSGLSGVAVFDQARLEISESTVEGSGGNGIGVEGAAVALVSDSAIDGNGGHGIRVAETGSLEATGCSIGGHRGELGKRYAGLAVVGTAGTALMDSTVSDNDVAVALAPQAEADLEGTTFTGNGADVLENVVFQAGGIEDTTVESTTSTVPAELGLPPGEPYEEYVLAKDDSGRVMVGVPSAWSEWRSGPFSHEGQPHGWSVTASTDVDAFISGWDTAGVFVGGATDLGLTVEEYLDSHDLSEFCDFDAREPYDTPVYEGLVDRWVGCGAAGSVMEIAVVEPKDGVGLILVQIGSVTQADRAAAERALLSFYVDLG